VLDLLCWILARYDMQVKDLVEKELICHHCHISSKLDYYLSFRFEVFKFSLSGMDKVDQMEARIAQAIRLGAKPPKKPCLPYDELKTKLKSEREEAQRRKVPLVHSVRFPMTCLAFSMA